jgi:hypothetical protein
MSSGEAAAPVPGRPDPAARTPKGMHDVLWPESARWEATVARFALLVEGAGYGLTVTPILEHAGVFLRGIGEGSEVVGKEMYVFEDRDGQMMALRPEGTAPIARAFVQHHPVPPWKAWYVAPSFRHENPQHGRYRQHHQLGVEALGVEDADLDVEVVSLAHDFFAGLGLRQVTLKLHSMGDGVCKPGYVALLGAFLAERADQLCPAHRARHLENPLRVLDCKSPECRAATADAPHFLDHLCDPCAAHFARVRVGLDSLGVGYTIDHRLVRGFDYSSSRPRRWTRRRTASGAVGATTGWSSYWAGIPPRASGSGSESSGCCSRATPRASSRHRRWWRRARFTPTSSTSPAGRLPCRSRPNCAERACGPTGPSTGAP